MSLTKETVRHEVLPFIWTGREANGLPRQAMAARTRDSTGPWIVAEDTYSSKLAEGLDQLRRDYTEDSMRGEGP